jgi:hypothetical protein
MEYVILIVWTLTLIGRECWESKQNAKLPKTTRAHAEMHEQTINKLHKIDAYCTRLVNKLTR